MRNKYTKEILEATVTNAVSVAAVLRALSVRETGGSHSHISRKLKEYEIDTSHFLGRRANCGENHKGGKKRSPEEILILRHTGRRECSVRLRRALIQSGREYKCELCSIGDMWNGKPIRLEVDHIDGNWLDDRKENLRFACPNCHSQQPHKMNRGLTDVTSRARQERERRKKKKEKRPSGVTGSRTRLRTVSRKG